jgi:prepilin-type N-terminal cleavage/methylation domain-containing protein
MNKLFSNSPAKPQSGFTLVELILAMALFSFALLIITAGFLNIVRLHQSGLASRNTQQNTRYGMEDIVREARGSYRAEIVAADPIKNKLCLFITPGPGGGLQFYVDGDNLRKKSFDVTSNSNYAAQCAAQVLNSSDPVISSSDVAIREFIVEKYVTPPSVPGDTPPESIKLKLAIASTSDSTLISGSNCNPGVGGHQFCAVTILTSSASLRGTAK